MKQCEHWCRGPRKGRIYIYDAERCQRKIRDDQHYCWQHRPERSES